jgi:uncharacterized protein
MKTAIAQALLHFVILSFFFLLACRQTKRIPVKEWSLFFLVLLLDYIILMKTPRPSFLSGSSFSWHNKIFEANLGLLFMLLYRKISFREYGLTAKMERGSLKPIVIVFLLLTILTNARHYISNGFSTPGTESLFYFATMPGIAEELVFRGVLLALVNRAFGKPWKIFGTQLGWGFIIVSVLYGLLHGLTLDGDLKVKFDLSRLLITMLIGFALAWAKEKSGSLIPGMVGHNLINLAGAF